MFILGPFKLIALFTHTWGPYHPTTSFYFPQKYLQFILNIYYLLSLKTHPYYSNPPSSRNLYTICNRRKTTIKIKNSPSLKVKRNVGDFFELIKTGEMCNLAIYSKIQDHFIVISEVVLIFGGNKIHLNYVGSRRLGRLIFTSKKRLEKQWRKEMLKIC